MYRTTLAQQSDCMPYMIASNKMLVDVAKSKPKDVSELKNSKISKLFYIFVFVCVPMYLFLITVEGFIDAKIERFGQAIVNKVIEVCSSYSAITKQDMDDNVNTAESE